MKENGELKFLYSMSGSDCPSYYENIKTEEKFNQTTEEIKDDDRAFWLNWPCVWETSKTSDDCIIVEPLERKWFEVWKPKNPVKIWVGVHYEKREGELRNDETKMWFSDIPYNDHCNDDEDDEDWKLDHLKLFTLPKMKCK